jgi:hypothetical protein
VLYLCYVIWLAWNKACFDRKHIIVENVLRKAWSLVDAFNLIWKALVTSVNDETSNFPSFWTPLYHAIKLMLMLLVRLIIVGVLVRFLAI